MHNSQAAPEKSGVFSYHRNDVAEATRRRRRIPYASVPGFRSHIVPMYILYTIKRYKKRRF